MRPRLHRAEECAGSGWRARAGCRANAGYLRSFAETGCQVERSASGVASRAVRKAPTSRADAAGRRRAWQPAQVVPKTARVWRRHDEAGRRSRTASSVAARLALEGLQLEGAAARVSARRSAKADRVERGGEFRHRPDGVGEAEPAGLGERPEQRRVIGGTRIRARCRCRIWSRVNDERSSVTYFRGGPGHIHRPADAARRTLPRKRRLA
jgi:hypothetical protein